MNDERTKKRLLTVGVVLLALVLPVALAAFGGWSLWKERKARQAAQVEFNEAMRQSLERAA